MFHKFRLMYIISIVYSPLQFRFKFLEHCVYEPTALSSGVFHICQGFSYNLIYCCDGKLYELLLGRWQPDGIPFLASDCSTAWIPDSFSSRYRMDVSRPWNRIASFFIARYRMGLSKQRFQLIAWNRVAWWEVQLFQRLRHLHRHGNRILYDESLLLCWWQCQREDVLPYSASEFLFVRLHFL